MRHLLLTLPHRNSVGHLAAGKTDTETAELLKLQRTTVTEWRMRYTHVGVADQARALAALSIPNLHFGGTPVVPEVLSGSQPVAGMQPNGAGEKDVKPCNSATSDASKQEGASDDSDAPKWRRRESNPRPVVLPCPYLRA